MNNDTYVFEGLLNFDLTKAGFEEALAICVAKKITNIKLVMPDFNFGYGFIAEFLSGVTGESADDIEKRLAKRGYRIDNLGIGINVISIKQFSITSVSGTVLLFIAVTPDTFSQVQKEVLGTNDDVVLCVTDGFYSTEFQALLNRMNIVSYKKV